MKELKATEAQLRSWQPRQPASRLKQKISSAGGQPLSLTWLWGALAPAFACVIVTMSVVSHEGDAVGTKAGMAAFCSNTTCSVSVAGTSQSAQNHLSAVTFDSTNHSGIQTIIAFTPATNFSN